MVLGNELVAATNPNEDLELEEGPPPGEDCMCMCFCEEEEEDSDDPEEEEEEEEEEIVDPQDELKDKCSERKECVALKEKLDECNARVEGRSKTSETCVEEIIDFMHCVDHCVSKALFSKLK